jgi:hypothetical protein
MNRELIALRNGFVQIPEASGEIEPNHIQVVMSTQAELMKLGYMLSGSAVDALNDTGTSQVIKFHERAIGYLKKMLGVGNYRPFYVNFPQQVMDMSDVELFVNAVMHYWSNGTWEPEQKFADRKIKFENVNFKMLEPVSGDEWIRKIAYDLASFTKPLDSQRLEELIWIAKNVPNVEVCYISVKETLCALGAQGVAVKITSPIDVLRIATGLSGGDIALPGLPKPNAIEVGNGYRSWTAAERKREAEVARETFKFKKFTRAQRKYLLNMLENLKTIDMQEMARHLGRWIRLGEILHPGEFSTKFPKAFAAFNQLRNEKVRTFAGNVDLAFKSSAEEGLAFLKTRPGEFARRLDSLVRQYDTLVLPYFADVADKVSGKVVFEMFDHFEGRRKSSTRAVMIKGSGAKLQTLEELPALPVATVNKIQTIVLNSLKKRFAKLGSMGKVYIDEGLKNIPVPFSMQSSAEGASTYTRGTRVPFREDAKVLRGYCHWYDENGGIDIDLAAGFYSADFKNLGEIAYYALNNPSIGACHSGDIRHRRGHCAEYVDVPIKDAIKAGVRYVIFTAYNFNNNSIGSVPQCTFGVMEREFAKANEIFDAKTVTNAVKLEAKSNSVFPVAFDLERKQWIWMDLEHDQGRGLPNLASDTTAKKQFEAILNASKLSIYDLLKLHVEARGGELTTVEQAGLTFLESDFRTSYTKLTPFLAV